MRKSTKKKIIIIATVVIALAVAVPVSLKNIRSYMEYADDFGSDTIQEAVERAIENDSYKERLTGTYPRKALEHKYGRKWWENSEYLENEEKSEKEITQYGRRTEYRYLEISSIRKVDTDYLKYDLGLEDVYDAGLKIEEAYGIGVSHHVRIRYDFDATPEEYAESEYSPVGEWSEWTKIRNQPYIVYKVAGKWYCMYWGK